MKKNYARKKFIGILYILIAIILSYDFYRIQNFNLIYDGLRILVSLISLINGIWCLFTPIVQIRNNIVKINDFIFTITKYDLNTVKEIGYDKSKNTLIFDSNKFKMNLMQSENRDELVRDLKSIRQSSNNQ